MEKFKTLEEITIKYPIHSSTTTIQYEQVRECDLGTDIMNYNNYSRNIPFDGYGKKFFFLTKEVIEYRYDGVYWYPIFKELKEKTNKEGYFAKHCYLKGKE